MLNRFGSNFFVVHVKTQASSFYQFAEHFLEKQLANNMVYQIKSPLYKRSPED